MNLFKVSLKVWTDHRYRTAEGYNVQMVIKNDTKRKVISLPYKTELEQ